MAGVHGEVPLQAIRHWYPDVWFEGWRQRKSALLRRFQEGEGEGGGEGHHQVVVQLQSGDDGDLQVVVQQQSGGEGHQQVVQHRQGRKGKPVMTG